MFCDQNSPESGHKIEPSGHSLNLDMEAMDEALLTRREPTPPEPERYSLKLRVIEPVGLRPLKKRKKNLRLGISKKR